MTTVVASNVKVIRSKSGLVIISVGRDQKVDLAKYQKLVTDELKAKNLS